MHTSAQIKAELFVKHYARSFPRSEGKARVLEVGSKVYLEQNTLRPLFRSDDYTYTGLDIEAGDNVDIVPADTYVWRELKDEAFDVCVSSQTFEHNPYFWVTFCEMARVLSPSGLMLLTAPGGGAVHRFPYDCWRFYPDSWAALCTMAGMEIVETHFEQDRTAPLVPGGTWRDSSLIARKPKLSGAARERFYARLSAIVAPFENQPIALNAPPTVKGPCFADYEAHVTEKYKLSPAKKLERALRRYTPPRITD